MGLPILRWGCGCIEVNGAVKMLGEVFILLSICNTTLVVLYAYGPEAAKARDDVERIGVPRSMVEDFVLVGTIMSVLFNLVQVAMSALLVIGVHTNPKYMKPFYIWLISVAALTIVAYMMVAIYFFENVRAMNICSAVTAFLVLMELYFAWLVYSAKKLFERHEFSDSESDAMEAGENAQETAV